MARYLIVANQTLGGAALDRAVQERMAAGQSEFFIVVPMTEPRFESQVWAAVDIDFVLPAEFGEEMGEALEEARRRSEHRLAHMIERIQDTGGHASGTVGSSDPVEAVQDVLAEQRFDEILVSTLPAGLSRWLKLDLPSRLSRMTEIPVITVEAERDPDD